MRTTVTFLIAWQLTLFIVPTEVALMMLPGSDEYQNYHHSVPPTNDGSFQNHHDSNQHVNIIYNIIPQPVRIEKEIPVPIEVAVPYPVSVLVADPYPVTKKVFVPYKVYVKQRVPIIKRYPVERKIAVPVHVPMEVPFDVKVLVPQPIPQEKEVHVKVPVTQAVPYPVVKEVPVPVKVPVHVPLSYPIEKEVPYPVEVFVDKPVIQQPIPVADIQKVPGLREKEVYYPVKVSVDRPVPYAVPKHIPYGIRIPEQEPILIEKQVSILDEKPIRFPVEIPIENHVPVDEIKAISEENEEEKEVHVPVRLEAHESKRDEVIEDKSKRQINNNVTLNKEHETNATVKEDTNKTKTNVTVYEADDISKKTNINHTADIRANPDKVFLEKNYHFEELLYEFKGNNKNINNGDKEENEKGDNQISLEKSNNGDTVANKHG